MGLKKWEEAFKPMGKPKGFKLFYFMGDSNSTKLFKSKDFFWGDGKTKFLSEGQEPWPLVSTNPRKEKLQNQQL